MDPKERSKMKTRRKYLRTCVTKLHKNVAESLSNFSEHELKVELNNILKVKEEITKIDH